MAFAKMMEAPENDFDRPRMKRMLDSIPMDTPRLVARLNPFFELALVRSAMLARKT
jgi:hypothetical protein